MRTRTYMDIRNVKVAKPTKKHRLAIWECMLGTVYAMNEQGEVKYFDYKWGEAKVFAGIDPSRDLRAFKYTASYNDNVDMPMRNQIVLWILRESN